MKRIERTALPNASLRPLLRDHKNLARKTAASFCRELKNCLPTNLKERLFFLFERQRDAAGFINRKDSEVQVRTMKMVDFARRFTAPSFGGLVKFKVSFAGLGALRRH